MRIKTELWNGHAIRFVEKEPRDWWAIGVDPATALGYKNPRDALSKHVDPADRGSVTIRYETSGDNTVAIRDGIRGNPTFTIISEFGIYSLVFSSKLPEARNFQRWVFGVIKELRQASGLEGFEIFRMLDKEHQKDAMRNLCNRLEKPVRVDFIKANTIANKAISSKHGYPKMLKKGDMHPIMLAQRQGILDDTVDLMAANEHFGLGLSVSERIYSMHGKS